MRLKKLFNIQITDHNLLIDTLKKQKLTALIIGGS